MGLGLEGIGGAIGGLIGSATAGKGGQGKLKQISRLWKELQTPGFDYRALTPPELQLVAEYFPETYDAIVPQEVRLPEVGPEGRSAQLSAIYGMNEIAQRGLPLADRLSAQEGQFRLADEANRVNKATTANLAARGRLGGGTEASLRLGAGQTAANLAASMGRDLVKESLGRRTQALSSLDTMGAGLRGSDLAESSAKANAVNRFNELTAQIRNQAAKDAAAERARTSSLNVGTRQSLANENTLGKYETDLSNLNRKNALLQQNFGNEVTKTQGYTGALGQEAAYKEAKRAERIRNAQNAGQAIGGTGDLLSNLGLF